jgi:hypothetical protein
MRVGKGRKRAIEIVGAQVSVSNLNPLAFSISSLDVCLTGCAKVQ